MIDGVRHVALLVADQDEAVEWFSVKLGFVVTEDTMTDSKRWLTMSPAKGSMPSLVLALATTDAQRRSVGRQAAGRVFLYVTTRDLDAAYAALSARGVRFTEAPREEAYGRVAVFQDLYGNRWDLIE